MAIVDRRPQGRSPSAGNRKKFLDRYKRHIKDAVDRTIQNGKIKDIKGDRDVKVPVDRVDEPTFASDPSTGRNRKVVSGNTIFNKGDTFEKDGGGSGNGAGRGGSPESIDGLDDFEFTLTKDEFLDILFEDMKLPNYVKENLKTDFKEKRIRSGFSKEGIISQLNIKKTFEQSLARRIAHRAALQRKIDAALTEQEKEELKKRKVPFIEDVDLRYNLYRKIKYPVRSAVMFCLMDVSGSMGEARKDLAKRFFLLLYLFLEREYDNVDIRFIRHAETADEVDEDEFFYGKKTGGTIVSTCYIKMLEIIEEEYDPNIYNIYAAQASDGDNWGDDNQALVHLLEDEVLPKVQYLSYLQVGDSENMMAAQILMGMGGGGMPPILSEVYAPLVEKYTHFNMALAHSKDEVFVALRGLFIDE